MASLPFTPIAGRIRAPDSVSEQQLEPTALTQPNTECQPLAVAATSPPQNSVTDALFAAGSGISVPTVSNRLTSSGVPAAAPARFYNNTASAPASSLTLGLSTSLSTRPPVPTFLQSTGAVPQVSSKMVFQDMHGLGSFEGTAFSSPSMASGLDLHSSVSSASISNLGTVSPSDLLIQDPLMSTPNSAALTTLTSPSEFSGSPYADGFDISPNFGGDCEAGTHAWYPLFPQETPAIQGAAMTVGVTAGVAQASPVSSTTEDIAPSVAAVSRRRSGHSRTHSSSKHSSTSGVNAIRRREKAPLPPIVVENPEDTVAMKRARNTLAARKSRERKAMRLEELEEELAKMQEERDHWKKIALGQQE